MIVLTIITTNNNHTVYLNEALVNIKRIKLLSCSLYYPWHNLKIEEQIRLYDKQSIDSFSLKKFQLEIIILKLLVLNENFDNKAQVKIRTPKAAIEINNPIGYRIEN